MHRTPKVPSDTTIRVYKALGLIAPIAVLAIVGSMLLLAPRTHTFNSNIHQVDAVVTSDPYGVTRYNKTLVDVTYNVDGTDHTISWTAPLETRKGDVLKIWFDGNKLADPDTASGEGILVVEGVLFLGAATGGLIALHQLGELRRADRRL